MRQRKGAVNALGGGVAVLLLIGVIFGGIYLFGGESSPLASGEKAPDDQVSLCTSDTTPAYNFRAVDANNAGTELTEATNIYRKQGTTLWTAFTAGTGFAADSGDVFDICMGISTTDQTDNAYGQCFTSDPTPCAETPSVEKKMVNDAVETALTTTFWNADGVASTAEVFVADQSQTVSIKALADSDNVFGNPYIESSGIAGPQRAAYPNVICMDLNSTAWDKPDWVKFDGETMKQVGIPTRHSAAAAHTAYCYEAPVITESLMEDDRYLIRLNSDDTVAPAEDDTAYLYAANFYLDASTGEVAWGVEDEQGNAAGTDAADTVTLDFS